jgi:hypothetical protein
MGAGAIALLVMMAAASGAAAATPRQFDLDCSGSQKTAATGAEAAWSKRLSLDLDAKLWCEAGCASGNPIGRMDPDKVWLRGDPGAASRDPTAPMMYVDRMSGELTARDGAGQSFDATCHLAPFTRFERRLF